MKRIPIILLLFGFYWGCGEKEEIIILEKVNARVAEFEKKKKEECRKSLLERAEKMVDSLLLHDAQAQLRDSLNRVRPFKPVQPPPVPPIDSLEIKPIFDSTYRPK